MLCVAISGRNSFKGESVKPEKNIIFLKNGKTVNCHNSTG